MGRLLCLGGHLLDYFDPESVCDAAVLGAGGAKTAIEDFFDSKTLAETLGAKTFSRAPKIDDTKHFGKAAFAREIVEKKADSIDFSRFSDILDGVVAVIADYAKRHPPTP